MLGQKKWTNVVLLDNYKDATLVGRTEDLPEVNYDVPEEIFPVNMEMPEKRTKIGAILKSVQYSRMGLYNLIIKS